MKPVIIMGRNTWESLPQKFKPLPKRSNIVLSTKYDNLLNNIDPNQPKFFSSFQSAEHYCSIAQTDNIWIIGGEMLYDQALNYRHLKRILNWMSIRTLNRSLNSNLN